ncbi:thioesterase II family protein [Streptomyces pactum]|uniref:thioesterase II family protein n=1 Tax=Streptomyces pactum TaxID=68249 RepID=UPI0036F840C2
MTYLRPFTAAGAGTAGTVVVFPPSGAGCLRLRSVMPALPPGTGLLGVQLPGREDRLPEPAATSLAEVVTAVAAELRAFAPPGPLAFLGISLGAVIGYEVAGDLADAAPAALVVAAARAPEYWSGYPAADPPAAEVAALLPPEIRDSALAPYALASMRADLRLMAGYRPAAAPLDRTCLRTVSGARDDIATTEQMSGWRQRATDFRGHRVVDAGHHAFMDGDVLAGLVTEAAAQASAERASTERASAERASVDRTATEPAATESAAVGAAATEPAVAERAVRG